MCYNGTMKNKNIEILNELMEGASLNLWSALKLSREEGTYIPLDNIINILKDVFDEEEIKTLKKKL